MMLSKVGGTAAVEFGLFCLRLLHYSCGLAFPQRSDTMQRVPKCKTRRRPTRSSGGSGVQDKTGRARQALAGRDVFHTEVGATEGRALAPKMINEDLQWQN
jgi:hypothetical protein